MLATQGADDHIISGRAVWTAGALEESRFYHRSDVLQPGFRELERALHARNAPRKEPQAWLDQFRWEHNHVRPHEALGMNTRAQRWQKSERGYDPHPPRWQYPAGAWVRKVDSSGKLGIATGISAGHSAENGCDWNRSENGFWCTTAAPWCVNSISPASGRTLAGIP